MAVVLLIVYMVAGYWAVGRTIYANRVVYGSFTSVFTMRVIWGTLLGWLCIPWAIIKLVAAR